MSTRGNMETCSKTGRRTVCSAEVYLRSHLGELDERSLSVKVCVREKMLHKSVPTHSHAHTQFTQSECGKTHRSSLCVVIKPMI